MYFDKKKCVMLFSLLFLIIITSSIEAQTTCGDDGFMGRFNQSSNITLTQACGTCTFINITVTDPDSLIVFENVAMTESNSIFTFGPNSTISQKLGIYFVQGISNLDNPFKACYTVTNIATEISTPESIIYVVLVAVVFFMFLILVWGAIGLPARNRRNELGLIIGVEKLKYVKLGCMFLAYTFFIWFINILLILSSNLVALKQFEGFFAMTFLFLMTAVYPVFVTMIVIFFWVAAKDLKLVDLLTRGFSVR